ncbi:class I SAM-dependent methyltransferase [Deltaproteobacteria bacterium Smac51]|nr:class I SAM-dependent methyltransferase [Deltaproteobacteria bacterium Smac51]
MKTDCRHWTETAEEWIRWARQPGHDAFWHFRATFAEYIGAGDGKSALEIGCGEGRVCRELKKLGFRVTASDVVPAMVEAAREADSADEYVVADAAALPLKSSSFDLVVAYNSLMDIEDMPAAVREAGLLLKPGGTLFISVVHPFRDRGRFTGSEPDSPFMIEGSYYGREKFEAAEEINGLKMHFMGWSMPLEDYAAAIEEAELGITSIREPLPDINEASRFRSWTRIPLFLWMKVRKFCG